MKRLTLTLVFGAMMLDAQAAVYTVTCDPVLNTTGTACQGDGRLAGVLGTFNYIYAVTFNQQTTLNSFQIGWYDAPISNVTVVDDIGNVQPFDLQVVAPVQPVGPYQDHGALNTTPIPAPENLLWNNMTSTYAAGRTVYFAYNSIYPEVTAGWVATGTAMPEQGGGVVSATSIFSAAVGDGVGPIHIPIPEPSGLVLAALGAGLLASRRRARHE